MGRAKPHDELLWGITWLLWRPIRIRGGLRRCAGYSARPDAPRRFVSKRPEHLWLDAVSAFDVLVGPDGAEGVKAVNLFVDGQRTSRELLALLVAGGSSVNLRIHAVGSQRPACSCSEES